MRIGKANHYIVGGQSVCHIAVSSGWLQADQLNPPYSVLKTGLTAVCGGATDLKAYFLGLNYGLALNVWLQMRFVSAKSLDAAPRYDFDTWYLDFNGRF